MSKIVNKNTGEVWFDNDPKEVKPKKNKGSKKKKNLNEQEN